jgi:hypothetical protein
VFHWSTFPVSSPFSLLCLQPSFGVHHLSFGQHHGLSTGLPTPTGFNSFFILLSKCSSRTKIDILLFSASQKLSLDPHGQTKSVQLLRMVYKSLLLEYFQAHVFLGIPHK